jgi:serine/threonine-protein kinase RsbW
VDELLLAVGEACTNAVRYADPDTSTVFVQYSVQPDRVEVEVRNEGPSFEWTKKSPVSLSLEERREGGLGLYLMEQMVDELRIRSEEGVTEVTMIKMLRAA